MLGVLNLLCFPYSSDVLVCLCPVCVHGDVESGEVPSSVAVPAASGHHWTHSVARHPAAGNGMGGTCGGGGGQGGAGRDRKEQGGVGGWGGGPVTRYSLQKQCSLL